MLVKIYSSNVNLLYRLLLQMLYGETKMEGAGLERLYELFPGMAG